jgi:hypothetical protein
MAAGHTAFTSDTFRRPDGRWVFVAEEEGSTYELVHPDKFTPFTEAQLLAMKLDAMEKFDGRR